MIALDTNVLVRYLVLDDRKQADAARALVHDALDRGAGVFIGHIVLCELTWVLESVYDYPREAVRETLHAVCSSGNIEVEDADQVRRALEAHASGRGDIADYLIRERALASGCSAIATFDRKVVGEPGFRSP